MTLNRVDVHAAREKVLGEVLDARARDNGARTFLRFESLTLSYRQLAQASHRLAAGLAAHGVRPRDHVGVMLGNGPELVTLMFALARLGAVMVPINPALTGPLARHALQVTRASMLVVDAAVLPQLRGHCDDLEALESLAVCRDATGVAPGDTLGRPATAYAELLHADGDPPRVDVHPTDLQAILFTSGTTGPSKGVMVPHAQALTCAARFLDVIDFRPEDTVYCPLPLFHASAQWEGIMAPLLAGATAAVVERFSASRFWHDVRRFDASIAMGVFSMVPMLLGKPASAEDRMHRLRAFYTGRSIHDEAFFHRFGTRCVENYASTEAGIAIAARYGKWRSGTCGKACSDTHQVSIVDAWDRELPDGYTGELVIRPAQPFVITPGYYNDAEATARSFRNLWFHTGDLARRDADGYYTIVGRLKDCIRRRGENISAFEVEQAVETHPLVAECAAVAVPADTEEDEILLTVVVNPGGRLDHASLAEHCMCQLPKFMVPRYIEFIDALPRNGVGKIARHVLRRRGCTSATWDRQTMSLAAPTTRSNAR